MKIIISGYGRMGKEIEKIAVKRNHVIADIVDNKHDWKRIEKGTAAIIIDFSLPEVATQNIERAFDLGIPTVSGTTGWHDQIDRISELCIEKYGSLFYAPNFSIGVNVFFKTSEYLAKMMNAFDDYNISMEETHHIHKKDAPSGTAIAAAQGIIKNIERYNEWSLEDNGQKSIKIKANREAEVTGTHWVTYESSIDKLILKHEAKNRSGFACGAVMAAEFLNGKKGIFTMNDLIDSIIS